MQPDETPRLAFGPFVLDQTDHTLYRDGNPIPLTPKAFQTLRVLVERAGSVVSKDELMEAVWPGLAVEENNLNQQIRALRKALGEEGDALVETLPRIGYRLNVRAAGETSPIRSRRTLRFLLWTAAVLLVVAIPTASVLLESASPPHAVGSIAVLPFTNQSGNPDDAYLGFAIADSLIRRFAAAENLTTRATSTVTPYMDAPTEPVVAGRQLRVQVILTGSIRRSPTDIVASARLTRVDDGDVLWSASFRRDSTQLFDLPNDVFDAVARELDLRITDEVLARPGHQPTIPQAYEQYMKGLYLFNRRTTEQIEKSVAYLHRAVELDPGYAPAWSTLGDALGFLGRGVEARAAKEKVLEIDPTFGPARAGRALSYLLTDFNFNLAHQEFKRVIRYDPGYAPAHHWYAYYFAAIGDFERALEQIRIARRLDPVSLIIQTDHGEILYFARRFDEAVRQLEHVIELDPTFAQAHAKLGLAYQAVGRHADAVREIEQFIKLDQENVSAPLSRAQFLAAAGRRAEARRIVEENLAMPGQEYFLAEAFAAMGETDLAFEWLERAFQARRASVAMIKVEPRLDSLRGDPRFDEFLQRLGLAGR